ncbi:MAG: RidA family protein [Pigmentiphaga sp.]
MSMLKRLAERGIRIPEAAPTKAARILMTKRVGNLLFVSGQLPTVNGELVHKGRVGAEVTLEQAQASARYSALNVLGQAQAALPGGLDDIVSVVNVKGYVVVAEGFIQVAQAINGASDLMREVFGDEAGAHTRTALGVSAMPHGAILEVEAIFEVR